MRFFGVVQLGATQCAACDTMRLRTKLREMASRCQLLGHLDELKVLVQQREGGEIHALAVGEPGEAVLHFGLEVHRQLQGGPRAVELAAQCKPALLVLAVRNIEDGVRQRRPTPAGLGLDADGASGILVSAQGGSLRKLINLVSRLALQSVMPY